jgi:beta-N-acetylhexosaminidase
MTRRPAADPTLGRLADAVLIPPFAGPVAPDWIRSALGAGLAGVTLFGPNVADLTQFARLNAELKSAGPADSAPVLAIDEEGGDVTRISHQTGSDYPGNAALGAVDDVTLTQAVYAAIGAELAGLGINLDLAPTVDVNTAADNPVIGTRAFGADTALVARHAAAAVAGLQSAGVAACAKHFPGHGSTRQDSHDVIPTIDDPLSLVRSRDLPPFEAVIAAGVRAIMPSHLRVPELTGELPASLSPAAQTGLLRGELGFTGLIVSDALDMRAVSEPYGIGEAAVLAVLAGTDLLCLGRDVDQATYLAVRDALVDAARSGRLPGERLEEAAARVAELRAWIAWAEAGRAPEPARPRGDSQGRPPEPARPRGDSQGRPPEPALSDGQIGQAAARRAVLVSGGLPGPLHRPLVAQLVPPANIAVGSVPWGVGSWLPSGSTRLISTQTPALELPAIAADVLTAAAGRSLLIVVRDAHRYPVATALVEALLAARPDAVIIEMGLPIWRPRAAASYLASYGAARSNALAVADLLGLAAAQ